MKQDTFEDAKRIVIAENPQNHPDRLPMIWVAFIKAVCFVIDRRLDRLEERRG